jgi:hypothetical protein
MPRTHRAALALLILSAAMPLHAQEAPATAPAPAPAPAARPQLIVIGAPEDAALPEGAVAVPQGTMVRLMVLNEVNTHKAKPGDTFVLRVDEDVVVDGTIVVPVGATAWGEVTAVEPNGAVGKAGTIGARLLYLEAGGERIALTGEENSKGNKGGDRVVLAMAGFGLFGLLARGSQGKLKAGHIFNGYVAERRLFDIKAAAFLPATGPMAAEQ